MSFELLAVRIAVTFTVFFGIAQRAHGFSIRMVVVETLIAVAEQITRTMYRIVVSVSFRDLSWL